MSSIKKIDNLEIISNYDNVICRKKINYNINNVYNYLKSRNFKNILDYQLNNGYVVRNYIEEINITKEDKLNELIYIISMLHTKTTHYKTVSINDIKIFYEKMTDEIIDIKKYYNNICEKYDHFIFLRPSIYYLINNISIILISLDNSKYFLDKWYEIIKDKKRKRVVLNHNNLKITNLLVSNFSYLINFDKCIIDYPIYDLVSIFKNNYEYLDMIDIFNIYNSKYNLYEEEKYLLFSILLKIDKIEFNKSDIVNTRKVVKLISYLKKVSEFLKYNVKTKE